MLADANGTYSYDLDLAPSNGSASFNPAGGVSVSLTNLEMSNEAPPAASGCTLAKPGDTWLALGGAVMATFDGSSPLTTNATGCYDVAARQLSLSAGFTGSLSLGPVTRGQPLHHRNRGRLLHRRRPGQPVCGHAQRRHVHGQRGP